MYNHTKFCSTNSRLICSSISDRQISSIVFNSKQIFHQILWLKSSSLHLISCTQCSKSNNKYALKPKSSKQQRSSPSPQPTDPWKEATTIACSSVNWYQTGETFFHAPGGTNSGTTFHSFHFQIGRYKSVDQKSDYLSKLPPLVAKLIPKPGLNFSHTAPTNKQGKWKTISKSADFP